MTDNYKWFYPQINHYALIFPATYEPLWKTALVFTSLPEIRLLSWCFLTWDSGCSVTQSCPTVCEPMNCSAPGFPILHYLLEFAQNQVHWVNDVIQPSHPLLPPSPSALKFPSISAFSNELVALCFRWPKYWSFSFSISPSNEYSGLVLELTGLISLQSKGLSRVFSRNGAKWPAHPQLLALRMIVPPKVGIRQEASTVIGRE